MKKSKLLLTAALALLALVPVPSANARKAKTQSVPVTHIMLCCRSENMGTKFLVNGEWNPDHDYRDISQVRSILQSIKDAGISIVCVDFTNPSQWNTGDVNGEPQLWSIFEPMLLNVEQVCQEKDMQFIMFIGNPAAWTMKYWNEKAGIIWDRWAQKPTYRRYGFGDRRPMLVVFFPGSDFQRMLDETPMDEKDNLLKFHIGTCQVNDPVLPVESDGWGYRNYSQSVDGKVRFVAPNGGVPPQDWYRIDAKEWKKRVEWAGKASEYSVFGSYDDICDAIFWGIADVSEAKKAVHRNASTEDDPFVYYNILKEYLAGR